MIPLQQVTHQFHLSLGDILSALTCLAVLWPAAQFLFFLFLVSHHDCSRAHPVKLPKHKRKKPWDPACDPAFRLPSHLPNSWRKHSRLEIIFPPDFESIALLSLASSVSVERSTSDSNLNLSSLSMHVVPISFWKLFLQCFERPWFPGLNVALFHVSCWACGSCSSSTNLYPFSLPTCKTDVEPLSSHFLVWSWKAHQKLCALAENSDQLVDVTTD